jgi:hypothetical protein
MEFDEDGAAASTSKLNELDGMSDDDMEDDKKTATNMKFIVSLNSTGQFRFWRVKMKFGWPSKRIRS